ncbi:hypothetical protein SYJ56_08000 [Algoriphagus sp. D3-2-R+10]|uniref:hypothetical protein n=1 Tax=Algoriphagus aurantiacus TaxID=3103948 RepID=UPI002B3698DC|nr:hypothetical protein [Algoriphagus sp. D3-2-R+10]MEB2775247.1 hypothetical protein [Algoriphagus sp. D3-2-R+10]
MKLLYKYCSIESAVCILESGNIRFNSPRNFQDKKDVPIDLVDFSYPKLHNDYIKDLEELKILEPQHNGYLDVIGNVRAMYKKLLNDKYNKAKVTCFSLNYNSNFCWFHYADNSRGIVFQFDLNEIFDEYKDGLFGAGKVNYIKKYRDINFFKYPKFDFYNYFLYNKLKSKYWQEEEFRFVYLNNLDNIEDFKDFRFNPFSLKAIKFGKKCSEDDKLKILNLLSEKGIDVKIIQ